MASRSPLCPGAGIVSAWTGSACDGLEAAAGSGQRLWAIDLLELVAITASDLSHHAEAARLLGAAEAHRAVTGYALWGSGPRRAQPALHEIESVLGSDAFQRTLFEGQALSLQDAVAVRLPRTGQPYSGGIGVGQPHPSRAPSGFSGRRWPDQRRDSQQLFVSTGTVKSHLTRVFEKLGVANRSRLARLAKTHLPAVGDVSGQKETLGLGRQV